MYSKRARGGAASDYKTMGRRAMKVAKMSPYVVLIILALCTFGGVIYLALAYMPLNLESKGFLAKLHDRVVVRTLRKPFKRVFSIVISIIVGVSIALTFAPLQAINFIYGYSGWKVWTKLMRAQPVRGAMDGFYVYVLQKRILRLMFTCVMLVMLVLMLPLTLAMQILGNVDYIRVLAFLVSGPLLIMEGIRQFVGLFATDDDASSYVQQNAAYKFAIAPNNKSLLINAIAAYLIIIAVAMVTYRNSPSVYDFCFFKFSPATVAAMLLATCVFVHFAMVIYSEDKRAGRSVGVLTQASVRGLRETHRHVTLASLCAVVVGAMFLREWNAGYVERAALLNARFYALE